MAAVPSWMSVTVLRGVTKFNMQLLLLRLENVHVTYAGGGRVGRVSGVGCRGGGREGWAGSC